MTQEEKDLLLKDLCARLPYEVKCKDTNINVIGTLSQIGLHYDMCVLDKDDGNSESCYIPNCKPYLFPLSSMTEEQLAELKEFADLKYEHNTLELAEWGWDNTYKTLEFWLEEIPSYCVIKVFDWLDENNFDYRGLIPLNLAIDATNLNIYKS